jgi:VWFA-related protein
MKTSPLVLLFGLCAFAGAQAPADAPVTLHARARIVVVDVVVTDAAHHPVFGLKRDQFVLTEDKKPQQLKAFEEHAAPSAGELAKVAAVPKLPPGIFTNYVPAPAEGQPLNVVLLDALNTPLTDQQYVRQQLLDFLKHEPAGTSVAVFGLSTQLVLLQGFTSDPNLLRQVLEKQTGKGSILLDNVVGGEGATDSLADSLAASQPPAQPGSGIDNTGPNLNDVIGNLRTFEDINTSFQLSLRIRYTLDGLNELARYLSNIPGRKNLIWFSGSFPLNVLPSSDDSTDPFAAMVNAEQEYRETTELLTKSQVAVYPIDARGLQTPSMYNATQSGTRFNANPGSFNKALQHDQLTNAGEHQTMSAMANDTGGEAFYNTNGLSQAVSQAVADGSNYYTLVYTPTDGKDNGQFRRIDVKLTPDAMRNGFTLSYRRGYYADLPEGAKAGPAAGLAATPAAESADALLSESLMQKAMQHGVPGSTQIVYTVRILPDAAAGVTEDTLAPENVANRPGFLAITPPYRRYRVDFGTDPSHVEFTKAADGTYDGTLQFVCFVYQPDGQVVNSISNTISLRLSPARYLGMMKSGGISFHQEISVPAKGEYSIRTGVEDLTSNRIGSAEVPLPLVKNLAPLPSPPQVPAK